MAEKRIGAAACELPWDRVSSALVLRFFFSGLRAKDTHRKKANKRRESVCVCVWYVACGVCEEKGRGKGETDRQTDRQTDRLG